jgi:hypothetical protein
VKRWIPDIMPFRTEDDRSAYSSAAARRGSGGYEMFQRKADDVVKIMLKPWS